MLDPASYAPVDNVLTEFLYLANVENDVVEKVLMLLFDGLLRSMA